MLCSYSNNIEDVRHVAVAISLDDAVFITVNHMSLCTCIRSFSSLPSQNFRKALEEEWKLPLSHRLISNVFFKQSSASVSYRLSHLKGWCLTPDTSLNIVTLYFHFVYVQCHVCFICNLYSCHWKMLTILLPLTTLPASNLI